MEYEMSADHPLLDAAPIRADESEGGAEAAEEAEAEAVLWGFPTPPTPPLLPSDKPAADTPAPKQRQQEQQKQQRKEQQQQQQYRRGNEPFPSASSALLPVADDDDAGNEAADAAERRKRKEKRRRIDDDDADDDATAGPSKADERLYYKSKPEKEGEKRERQGGGYLLGYICSYRLGNVRLGMYVGCLTDVIQRICARGCLLVFSYMLSRGYLPKISVGCLTDVFWGLSVYKRRLEYWLCPH